MVIFLDQEGDENDRKKELHEIEEEKKLAEIRRKEEEEQKAREEKLRYCHSSPMF